MTDTMNVRCQWKPLNPDLPDEERRFCSRCGRVVWNQKQADGSSPCAAARRLTRRKKRNRKAVGTIDGYKIELE